VFSVVVILLYYDLRIRKEGFDLQMMARELAIANGHPVVDDESAPSAQSQEAERCAHCRFPIHSPSDSTTCESCGAKFHVSCKQEIGGCNTPGCPANSAAGSQQV
jgi:hypothetical protein